MYVLLIVVCPFVLFLLAIVLSVLLRLADSDYPFGIFKLFLSDENLFILIEDERKNIISSTWFYLLGPVV
jgi:hypothetical protein